MDKTLKEKHATGVTKEKAMEFGLPKHWENCPKIGKIIQGIFLPFKTPLSDAYDDFLEDATKFYPQEIFDNNYEGVKDGAKVKLWINLSYTERYYGWKAVTSNDCQYVHIPLRGHKETPSEEETKKFIGIVNDFVKEHPNDIIAVHCTHGFNRTGFLIASYLIQTMKWNVEKAVKEFAEARPNGIYKEDYLKDLCQRFDSSYNLADELPFDIPNRPEWDTNISDTLLTTGFADNSDRKPRFMNANVKNVAHIDDPKEQETLLKKIRKLLQPFSSMNLETTNLFSSQPVALDKRNIDLLSTKPYMVSWKADGIRYLIYIEEENKVYAFDRDRNIFKLPLKFPRKGVLHKHVLDTLIDVEMVIEKKVVGGKTFYNNKMLIFDIIIYGGREIGREDYQKRFDAINNYIILPRSQAVKQSLLDKRSESITVYRKEFYNIFKTKQFLAPEFAETMAHRIDGLIFQPSDEPYTAGRFQSLLKWKNAEDTTIDFFLKIVEDESSRFYAELYLIGCAQPFRKINAPKFVQKMDGRIVECGYNKDKKFFVKRERKDKSSANSYRTATSIMKSLDDPVSKEFLIEYIEKNGMKQEQKQKSIKAIGGGGAPRQFFNRNRF